MRRILLDNFLCCPVDRSYPLFTEDATWSGDEMESGVLRCPSCARGYNVISGIPDLVSAELQPSDVAAAKQREMQARDADATVYDSNVADYHTQVEISSLVKALKIKNGDVVVDLGAGTGRLTVELARRGATVLALDISPRSLAVNREKCSHIPGSDVHFVVADASYLPLRDSVADRAGSGMMIEHLPTPEDRSRCINDIARVLRPHGRLALTAYNYSWGKRRASKREGFHGHDLYYYRFERSEFRQLLSRYRVRTLTAILNLPASLRIQALDRAITAVPALAGLTGELIFAVAEREA